MIKAQDYSAGLQATDAQLASAPRDATLLRLKGICLMEKNQTDEAVKVLRQAVALDSQSIACRFYLAKALAYQGATIEAVQLLEEVVKAAPDSEYGRLATEVLPQLRQLAQTVEQVPADASALHPRRYSVNLRVAGEHDDNVPYIAKNEGGSRPKDSFRLATSTYLEFRPLDQKIDATPVTLGLGYAGYVSFHDRPSMRAFNVEQDAVLAYLSRAGTVLEKPYEFRVGGRFDYTELDRHLYSRSARLDTSFTLQPANWAVSVLQYSAAWTNFADDTILPALFARDGREQSLGFTQYIYLWENRLLLGVGYAYVWDGTTGQLFHESCHHITLSAQVSLPWRLTFKAFGEYRHETYFDYVPAPHRLDDIFSVTAAISCPVVIDNLTAEFAVTSESADSAQGFAAYRRNVVSLALNYSF